MGVRLQGAHVWIAWLAFIAVAVQARVTKLNGAGVPHHRALQDYAAQDFCPDGCADDGCTFAATGGGFKCQKCNGNLIVNKITGNCACPAGKYASSANWCSDCEKGSYCAGNDYFMPDNPLNPLKGTADEGKIAPVAVPCPMGSSGQPLTTLGKRAISIRACVNLPGSYYVLKADGGVDQVTCAANTYSPGLKKQRACVPCPTGYTTNGVVGAMFPTACVVPAGYYLKTIGQVAPCPKGEWKAGIGPAGNCTKCAAGVTTAKEASTSSSECTLVAPGWYASAMANGIVTDVEPCPQGYWCTGGQPSQPFDPRNPNPDTPPVGRRLTQNTGTIFQCPLGMLTIDLGASTKQQCLTPPGHYTDATGTYPCPSGYYRPGWVPYGDATTCIACGEGVKSAKTDQITLYDIATRKESYKQVTTSSEDWYIMPGQGLYYTSVTKSYRIKNCVSNEYGVSNITYGLNLSPCRPCPDNMVASKAPGYPNSTRYYVKNGDAEGFADPRACVTIDGYGYDGRGSSPCEVGTYNQKDTLSECKPCPWGFTTAGVGKGVTLASCGIAAGFGYSASQQGVVPCPIGTYNNASFTAGSTATCTDCGPGLTTEREGAYTKDQCSFCKAGWGGDGCQTRCGGEGVNATYGTIGRSLDTNPNCTACTTQFTGYSFFDSAGKNDLFYSLPVTRVGASQSTDCVAKWSQLVDGAWYIPMADNDAYSETFSNISTFAACVDLCNYDPCEFVTYDYLTKTCTRRNGTPPVYVGAPLIAFKNLPSGDVGTNVASVRAVDSAAAASGAQDREQRGVQQRQQQQDSSNKAKLVSTGIYTFYREELALTVGVQEDPAKYGYNVTAGLGDQFLQNCLNVCDYLGSKCAGITIRMNVEVKDRPTTCKLIMGRTKVGVYKRTVMRAEPLRMPLPSLNDYDFVPSPSPSP